jgi:hypothetical protein
MDRRLLFAFLSFAPFHRMPLIVTSGAESNPVIEFVSEHSELVLWEDVVRVNVLFRPAGLAGPVVPLKNQCGPPSPHAWILFLNLVGDGGRTCAFKIVFLLLVHHMAYAVSQVTPREATNNIGANRFRVKGKN